MSAVVAHDVGLGHLAASQLLEMPLGDREGVRLHAGSPPTHPATRFVPGSEVGSEVGSKVGCAPAAGTGPVEGGGGTPKEAAGESLRPATSRVR